MANQDPALLVYKLLIGTPGDGTVTGIGTGINFTAADGTTQIVPFMPLPVIGGGPGTVDTTNPDAAILYVKRHPYQQELDANGAVVWKGHQPLVVIGPVKHVATEPMDLPWTTYDVRRSVEVRVLTRDWDVPGLGFALVGLDARVALVTNIRLIMEKNYSLPDGTTLYSTVRVLDAVDDDRAEAPGLYRTMIHVEVRWFETKP